MTHQNPERPDWRVFDRDHPHGTYDRHDTEGEPGDGLLEERPRRDEVSD